MRSIARVIDDARETQTSRSDSWPWKVTEHAAEAFRDRVNPSLSVHAAWRLLERCLPAAELLPLPTRRGQQRWLLPGDERVVAVCKPDPLLGRRVAVTVLGPNFAERMGRSGVHVVNLFSFRTPYPEDLRDAHRRGEDIIGPRGDEVFDGLQGTVICAWGPPKWPFVRERARVVAERITARGIPLYCLGTAKDGSPRHPLMLRNDAALVPWEAVF